MKISEAKIGMNVNHKIYGDGKIIEIKDGFFVIRFNKWTKDKCIRSIMPDYLTCLDYVSGIQNIKTESKNLGFDIIDDDELMDENIDTSFAIIPSNYSEQSCYSTNAKRLFNFLKKKYTSEGIATIKAYKESDGEVGLIIMPSKGIIIFKLKSNEFTDEQLTSPMFNLISNSEYSSLKDFYINKFYQSKALCEFKDNYKILKYPIRFVLVYQSIDLSKLSYSVRNNISIQNKDIYFKNFTTIYKDNELFSNFENYDDSFNNIDTKMFGSIIERIIPEYATLTNIAPEEVLIDKSEKINDPIFVPITGNEREFSALCLDDVQIKSINDTKPGHYLTLANPGTGKSVLLISKAYRIQSIENEHHVLITCYNKNLAEHHTTFAELSGMKTPYLHISTFHKFMLDILRSKDPYFLAQHHFNDESENFDLVIERVEQLISLNKVETNLNAIFIDEIQLFDPKWIDICYKLLDKSNGKQFYFEMFGDINQDVRSQKSKGKASWQRAKILPSLQGRVKKLDRNYRNTDLIAGFIKEMIESFNEYLLRLGFPIDSESSCLTSETRNKGYLRTKIISSKNNDVSSVVQVINELVTKKQAEYNEIAVIYPARSYSRFYKPVWHIQKIFDENKIPYSFIHGEYCGRDARKRLFDCDGIIMSTIDSCLGLDFKYVILCGLHYFDFYYDMKNNNSIVITEPLLFANNNVKYYFSEIGKKIYSACSRAREGLYIIDDLNRESPIKKILIPKNGGKYFDVY